jgi:hypothetical protein
MSKSDWYENKVLDVIGGTSITAPATVYVALYTVAPTDSSAGTEVSTSGTGYARAAVTNNSTNWPAASGGSKSNGTQINFNTPTASWGTVVGWAIVDTASGAANIYYKGTLAASKNVNSGDPAPYFAVGAITLTED